MRRNIWLATSAVLAFALGGATILYLQTHPIITSVGPKTNSVDVRTALNRCALYGSWPVELKKGQQLFLEQRNCPARVTFSQDDDDTSEFHTYFKHGVLLLEKRQFGSIKVLAVLIAELDFTTVQVGKTSVGTDAVLWSYNIVCGSCHGGPDGVLAWSSADNAYIWNEDWLDTFDRSAKLPIPDGYNIDEAPSLVWNHDRTALQWGEPVYTDKDANCCPSGGNISAEFSVKGGQLVPQSIDYAPSKGN